VYARTSWNAERVRSHTVIVEDQRHPWGWPPKDLPTKARMAVKFRIRLPAIDEPRLDFQFLRREPLNADSVENHGVLEETKDGWYVQLSKL